MADTDKSGLASIFGPMLGMLGISMASQGDNSGIPLALASIYANPPTQVADPSSAGLGEGGPQAMTGDTSLAAAQPTQSDQAAFPTYSGGGGSTPTSSPSLTDQQKYAMYAQLGQAATVLLPYLLGQDKPYYGHAAANHPLYGNQSIKSAQFGPGFYQVPDLLGYRNVLR